MEHNAKDAKYLPGKLCQSHDSCTPNSTFLFKILTKIYLATIHLIRISKLLLQLDDPI